MRITATTARPDARPNHTPTPPKPKLKAQSQATRQAYETASAQWKDIAETTALWFTKSLEPLQSVLHRSAR